MTSFQRGSAVTVTGGVRGAWPFAATLLLLVALGCSRSTQSGQRQGPESSTGSSPGSGSTAGTGSSTGSGAAASSGGGATASSSPAIDPSCPAPTNNQGEFNTPNTLYYLGDTYSGPTVVALSGEDLIWTWGGAGQVVVAPKNGCGTPVQLAQAHNIIIDLEATNEAAYWLGGWRLQRIPKAGGEIETVTSLPYSGYSGLLVTEDLAYVALPGCAAISRVHLGSLESETLTAPEPLEYSSGDTYLYLHEGTLYCSAWQHIFRVVDWDHLELLYSAGTWLFGFHYMSGVGYFLNRVDASNMQVWTLEGSNPTLRHEMAFALVSDPLVDEKHQRLWFGDSGGIGYYSTADNAYHLVANNGGCASDTYASDGTFLYWGRGDGHPRTIERIKLDDIP